MFIGLGLALSALFLYVLTASFVEMPEFGEERASFRWKIFLLGLGVPLAELVLLRWAGHALWAIPIVIAVAVLLAVALIYLCGINRGKAIKIAGIFQGVRLAVGVILAVLAQRA